MAAAKFDPEAVQALAERLWEFITDHDDVHDVAWDLAERLVDTIDGATDEDVREELATKAQDAMFKEIGRFLVNPKRWED